MGDNYTRRDFIKTSIGVAAAAGIAMTPFSCQSEKGDSYTTEKKAAGGEALFKISLAQWSLHKSIFREEPAKMGWDVFRETLLGDNYRSLLGGKIDPMDFAKIARQKFGIDAIEYVNTLYFDRAKDMEYLKELKNVAEGEGVKSLLIMCDALGNLGDPDEKNRATAVENHYPWVDAAKFLGCHSIRVNARSDESLSHEEQKKLAADGLRRLCEFADGSDINVIVENHGGTSSNGQWLAGVMEEVGHKRVGTLPDFGNFRIQGDEWYDRYKGVTELMPYAKAVSAKSNEFDENGNETNTDYKKMMKIVLDAGYRGYVGIEYEGAKLSEMDGIRATQALLERVREELAPAYA